VRGMPKLNLNRIHMRRGEPQKRARDFSEVALGYSPEEAKQEASRCLICPKPMCIKGCPVGVNIPGFIKAMLGDDMKEAVKVLKASNNLPGICGRVCPQESQCESTCVMKKPGAPVAIGRLERYVADWERKAGQRPALELKPPTGKKVAVVGAGPSSLTCAADLARLGHKVEIFEALHVPGGVLSYGIPEFRLPREIIRNEVEYIKSLGVQIHTDWVVGQTITIDELLGNGFNAVFLGTGAGFPQFLNIPGENLNGIYSANEFLTRTNLMKAYLFPDYDTPLHKGKITAVIGGGNVAMDAARCALRQGSEKVYIIYRRTAAEMPARLEEVENAEEEGVKFRYLTLPKRFVDNGKGWLCAMECAEMELGEPDESGRRRPVVKPGSDFTLEVDTVIVAVGTTPNPLVASTTPDLKTSKHGTLVADEKTGRTSKKGVWAGGDIVTGAATVISAMGAGKAAAADIDLYLKS